MGKLFVTDFYDFIFAVSASENDAKSLKLNAFITPITRDMDQKLLPAVKMENFLSPICMGYFYFVVSASENDAKCRKSNSFISVFSFPSLNRKNGILFDHYDTLASNYTNGYEQMSLYPYFRYEPCERRLKTFFSYK